MAQKDAYRGLVLVMCCGPGTSGCPETASASDTPRSSTRITAVDPVMESTTPGEWVRPFVPDVAPFEGTGGLSARDCGACHTAIYEEWSASTHAHAWVDPQFQVEIAKDPDVSWLCLNCHTPLTAQQEDLAVYTGQVRDPARSVNESFDVALRDEGITCLTCHWRAEGIAAPHRDVEAPHPVVYAPELQSVETCTACHQAATRLEDTLVCHFTTGSEWTQAKPGRTCQECHMPELERSTAPGAPVRSTRRHHTPGSGLPKDAWTETEAALFADWLPGVDGALGVPARADPGSEVLAEATLVNSRAGHRVPTGDPERFLRVTLRVEDLDGNPVAELISRVGQDWEWWPVARKLGDNRLEPGEERTYRARFTMPAGGARVSLLVDHVRISADNAAYHDLDGYPRERRVVEQVATISVEI